MGSETPAAFVADGEGPVRLVSLTAFYISTFAVTNAQFAEFARKTGYRTEAERLGWSFVFRNHVPPRLRVAEMPGTLWWVRVIEPIGGTRKARKARLAGDQIIP